MNILAMLASARKHKPSPETTHLESDVPLKDEPSTPDLQNFQELQVQGLASSIAANDAQPEATTSTPSKPPLATLPRKKRSRDPSNEPTQSSSGAKKAKLVQFHPDTNDNGVWATGRKLVGQKLRRQPTPFIHNDGAVDFAEFVDGAALWQHFMPPPSPSSDRAEYDDGSPPPTLTDTKGHRRSRVTSTHDSRGGCGVVPSNVNGFATAIPYPRMSIVMTDENGVTRAWDVSPDVFEDVGVYLEVRSVSRVSAVANLEVAERCGKQRNNIKSS